MQEIVLLNPCSIVSKNLMLSFIDKVRTGTKRLALFIWNVAAVVCIAATARTGGLASGLPATLDIIYISDIIRSFDHGN